LYIKLPLNVFVSLILCVVLIVIVIFGGGSPLFSINNNGRGITASRLANDICSYIPGNILTELVLITAIYKPNFRVGIDLSNQRFHVAPLSACHAFASPPYFIGRSSARPPYLSVKLMCSVFAATCVCRENLLEHYLFLPILFPLFRRVREEAPQSAIFPRHHIHPPTSPH
jgi:hypothetical protein